MSQAVMRGIIGVAGNRVKFHNCRQVRALYGLLGHQACGGIMAQGEATVIRVGATTSRNARGTHPLGRWLVNHAHTAISHMDFGDDDTIYALSTLKVYERTRWTLIAPHQAYILEHCLRFRDYSIESCSNRFSHSRSSST